MKVTDFITEQERKEYCNSCYELCGRACVIWRKASMRYDQAEREEQEKKNNAIVIDNENQKEFAHEIAKKFSFEELALYMYEYSWEY